MNYQALFEPAEEGGFVVTFPGFEFGVTQGDTEEEALEMAADALALVIESYIEQGKPLPKPSQYRGRKYRTVRLPAMQAMKAELYREFLASGMRKVDLARRLGIPKTVVDRLFDLNHHSRLDQIEAAFRALGKELAIEVRGAA
jgi:antitoxin HicB